MYAQSGKRKEFCSWQKSLAFAHIATTRLNLTLVLKLAHFIRSDAHSTATHATRARSLFAITLQAEQIIATLRFESSQYPRSAQITMLICSATIIRRSADVCVTFSFEHSVDIDTSKSHNIAIADISTFANFSLSPRDQLAKPGYSLHARDTSVRSLPDAMLR